VPLGVAGFAVSCVMLPGALAGWSCGALVDRFGAKRVALAGLAVSAAASLAAGLAGGFALLVAARIVEGVGYTLLVVAATVIVVQVAADRRSLALSIWSSFAPIGFALGQWAAAYAGGASPLESVGMLHAAVLAAAAVAVHLAVKPDAPVGRQGGTAPGWVLLRHAPALRTALAFGGSCAALLAAVALAPIVLATSSGLSVTHIASLTALAALTGIAGRIAPGWLLDRGVSARAVFFWASAVAAASIVAALLAPLPLWSALACFALFQIAAGALPGVLSAMIPRVAPGAAELGSVSGICTQMVNVGNLLGPPLALAIYAAASSGAAVALLVALLAASAAAIGGLPVFARSLAGGGR